jgi:uncharacterized membrane protein
MISKENKLHYHWSIDALFAFIAVSALGLMVYALLPHYNPYPTGGGPGAALDGSAGIVMGGLAMILNAAFILLFAAILAHSLTRLSRRFPSRHNPTGN